MLKKFPVKNIELWPRRTGLFDHSPEAKELMDQSLKRHGALPRFVGRPHPIERGKVQIPFGALTLERVRKRFGADYEVLVDVESRSNVDMILLCDVENSELWHNLPLHYLEIVQAVKIEIGPNGKLTGGAIAQFLGGDWLYKDGRPHTRTYWSLQALELIESGELKATDLAGLNSHQAQELIEELSRRKKRRERDIELAEQAAKRAKQEAERADTEASRQAAEKREAFERSRAEEFRQVVKKEAKQIVGLAPQMRDQKLAARDLKQKVAEIVPPLLKNATLPWITQAATRLANQLDQILGPDDARREKIRELIKHRTQLDDFSKELLREALTALSDRAFQLAEALSQSPTRPTASANPRKLKS